MKSIWFVLLLVVTTVSAQKLKKADRAIFENLKSHITYLADDKLEGRRTGTEGEKLAYQYISAEFAKAGLIPQGSNGTYLQQFEVNDGKMVNKSSYLIINQYDLELNNEYFPLSFSPNASLEAVASIFLQESDAPWFYDIKELLEGNKNNPHFDLQEAIIQKTQKIAKKGATALFIYNSSTINDELSFEATTKREAVAIPVIYITKTARKNYLNDETATQDIKLKVDIAEKKRLGHNVIGYINNGSPTTAIIGAHYDHLGYGEDNNSLSPDNKAIHNGADDNASGTGALIELAKMLKHSKFKNNNYVFIAFSGEELGLLGSNYFVENPTIEIGSVNYMINMDMIGRVNDSSHNITIGGFGTSPAWSQAITQSNNYFSIKLDSSGIGPSDHTSFYKKNIPVLFFFSGLHSDYHKPGDDAEKINYVAELHVVKYIYAVIGAVNKKNKLTFVKTREVKSATNTALKVTLGIMPDYSFSGKGVKVDVVIDNRPAYKAGVKPGDVLLQLGVNSFSDIQSYMESLNKFNKGDSTKIKLRRDKETLDLDVIF